MPLTVGCRRDETRTRTITGLSLTAPDDATDSLYGEEDPVCILPRNRGL